MSPAQLLGQPLAVIGRALRRKEVTSVALAQAALDQLDRQGRPLNAVAALMPDRALAAARAADAELGRGKDRGPLHGIPYGAKDIIGAEGAPTTWGVAFYTDRRLPDATVIRRLEQAGAVLVAKLATVQLAGAFGYERASASLQGPGRNPWDPTRWAGGSSSGPAAAVAARLLPFALGSETWGSILTPSTFCGITGLRPTFGRVSRAGVMALSPSMDKVGPLARSAQDAWQVLRALSGPDEQDPATLEPRPSPEGERLRPERLRVAAVLPGALEKMDREIYAAYQAVLEQLGKVAEVVPFDPGQPEAPWKDLSPDAVAILTLQADEASSFEELIESGQVRQLPATHGELQARLDRSLSAVDYLRAQRVRAKLRLRFEDFFQQFDGICSPALGLVAAVAPKLDANLLEALAGDDPVGSSGNLLGFPALAIPGPLVRGLPTGMQLAGAPWSEAKLAACVASLQRRTRWHQQAPRTA